MDDEVFNPPSPTMFDTMDFNFVDELFNLQSWSPNTDASNFLQLNQEEKEIWSLLSAQEEQIITDSDSQFQDIKSIIPVTKTENPTLDSDAVNRSLWIQPRAISRPLTTVKDRLFSAISQLSEMNRNRDVLIQTWVPVKKGKTSFLTTVEQPHFFQPTSTRLLHFRDVSEKYEFYADEESKQALGLPGRVFLGKVPEWTPDVRFFRQDEYPRVQHAQQCDVRGSIALPVFENGSDECLGVVEIIMTTQQFNYRPEVESICKALQTFHLRSSETLNSSQEQVAITRTSNSISHSPLTKVQLKHLSFQTGKRFYEAVNPEILTVLRTVTEKHNLPLAQTWASCSKEKGGCPNPNSDIPCVSVIDSACYIRDQRVLEFHKACSEHHLSRNQGGIIGQALETNQPCFSADVSEFSKTDYPLAHHAKMFGLRGAVAIRVCSIYQEINDCVLEFYLPTDLEETRLIFHEKIWESISMVIQKTCRSFKLITAKNEIRQEDSWFSQIVNPQQRSIEEVSLNFGEESRKERKFLTNWSNPEQDCKSEGTSGVSSGVRLPLGLQKAGKPRTNVQKTLSLEVLRQYFARSLKDAAKNIGVCPTTLKRICRQHGIARWPSRKIKKVGHSLQKLQLVINSVQGAEGSIQLSSFYTNFPELNSPNTQLRGNHSPIVNFNNQSKEQPTISTSQSASTSSSHSSSSGNCYPNRGNISSPTAEDIHGSLKRGRYEAELQILSHRENKNIVEGSKDNKDPAFESLPVFPIAKSWPSGDRGVFKAKATFKDEKIRFTILPNMGFQDLQQEMAKRFDLKEWSKISIKYLDDDKEWILLTCDADLEECIDMHRSSGSHIVKLSLSHFTNPGVK